MRDSLKVFILALKFPFKQKSFGSPEKALIVLLKFSVIWVPLGSGANRVDSGLRVSRTVDPRLVK